MDRDTVIALAPHYLAMLLLVFIVLAVWRTLVGELGLLGEFVIVFVVVFAYRPAVKRLGVAPESWQD